MHSSSPIAPIRYVITSPPTLQILVGLVRGEGGNTFLSLSKTTQNIQTNHQQFSSFSSRFSQPNLVRSPHHHRSSLYFPKTLADSALYRKLTDPFPENPERPPSLSPKWPPSPQSGTPRRLTVCLPPLRLPPLHLSSSLRRPSPANRSLQQSNHPAKPTAPPTVTVLPNPVLPRTRAKTPTTTQMDMSSSKPPLLP